MTTPRLTDHAVQRYQERVSPGSSRLEARMAVQQFVCMGRARANPRHWMADRRPGPGKRFVYWAHRPRVCAIVVDQTVVTIITRDLVRASDMGRARSFPPARPTLRLVVDERWRWDRQIDDWQAETREEDAA